MSTSDWSLAQRIKKAGFDLDLINLKNYLGPEEGFHRLAGQNAERQVLRDTVSSQLKMAGDLWALCKEYEMEFPSRKVPESFGGQMMHVKLHRESQVLLCQLKVTCANIWLRIYQSRKHKWPLNILVDLLSWLLEACDSLIASRQWSTVNSMMEHVVETTETLDGVLKDAFNGEQQAEMFFSECSVTSEYQRACLLWLKAKVTAFHALMQLKGMGEWKIGAAELQEILIYVPNKYIRCSMCIEYQCLSMCVAARCLKSCQYEESMHILASLLKFHRDWLATVINEPSIQNEITNIITKCLRKCSILLLWCRIHTDGSCLGDRPVDPVLAELPRSITEWLQKSVPMNFECSKTKIDACVYLDEFLRQNAKVSGFLGSFAWACSKLMSSRWKGMLYIVSQYANTHIKTEDYREIFLIALLKCLCCAVEEPAFFESVEKCEVFHAIVSNKNVTEHLQHNVPLCNEVLKLVWNAASEIPHRQPCLQCLLATALLLADIIQDVDFLPEILLCLSRLYFKEQCEEQAMHYIERAEQLNHALAVLARLEMALENESDQMIIERSIEMFFRVDNIDLKLASYFVCLALENEKHHAAALILERVLRLIVVYDDPRFRPCEPHIILVIFQNYFELVRVKVEMNSSSEFTHWVNLIFKMDHFSEISKSYESLNSIKYLVGLAWSLAKQELDNLGFGQASRLLFLASKLLDLTGPQDMEVQLKSQMMLGLASIIMVVFSNESTDPEQRLPEILSSLREKQTYLRSNSKSDETVSAMLDTWDFLRQYLSIVLLVRRKQDNMAFDLMRDIQGQLNFETLVILLGELKGTSCASKISCTRTYKAVLSHVIHSHSTRAVENPIFFADVIAEYLQLATGQDFFDMLAKAHDFLKSFPKETFPRYFLEWMYTACWNFALQEYVDGRPAEEAASIAIEGFQRENLLSQADQKILLEKSLEF